MTYPFLGAGGFVLLRGNQLKPRKGKRALATALERLSKAWVTRTPYNAPDNNHSSVRKIASSSVAFGSGCG